MWLKGGVVPLGVAWWRGVVVWWFHGDRRQPMCDPEGCATVVGVVGGGGGLPPALVDPNLGGRRVGWSAAGLPGGGGSVGTPTYIPQNDPHDTLIILNIHNWGKKNFKKICPST